MFKLKQKGLKNFISTTLNWDNCEPSTNGEYYLLKTFGHDWKLAIDIGANIGEYTERILLNSPKARIVSFEPNPEAASSIKKSPRVNVEVMAVGEKKGSLAININTDDSTQSSSYRKNAHTKVIKLPQTSLDSYIKDNNLKHIDFIKIDTEGHELSVLKGAKKILKNRQADYIQFEYGGTYKDAHTTLAMVYSLLDKDYVIGHILPQGIIILPYSNALETYRYSNWLAISRNIYGKVKK